MRVWSRVGCNDTDVWKNERKRTSGLLTVEMWGFKGVSEGAWGGLKSHVADCPCKLRGQLLNWFHWRDFGAGICGNSSDGDQRSTGCWVDPQFYQMFHQLSAIKPHLLSIKLWNCYNFETFFCIQVWTTTSFSVSTFVCKYHLCWLYVAWCEYEFSVFF